MRSLWTAWGVVVHTIGDTRVACAQIFSSFLGAAVGLVGNVASCTRFVLGFCAVRSTPFLFSLPLFEYCFSPLSTPPITATTKYLY